MEPSDPQDFDVVDMHTIVYKVIYLNNLGSTYQGVPVNIIVEYMHVQTSTGSLLNAALLSV